MKSVDIRRFFAASPAVCGVALFMGAHGAIAQTTGAATDADASGLQEIVVTAERRSERLQDTPLSVSVMTPEALERNATRDIQDLTGVVPGLIVGGKLSGGGNNPITIRGVTGQTVLTGLDAAVSIYLDGVYLSKPDQAFFTLADVERIEVLEGPQGTLYGRNATAGAINIITKNPNTTEWTGVVDGNYGNYGGYDGRGYFGGPIGGGFSASVSLAASGNDGYFRNSVTGDRENGWDTLTVRGKLQYVNESGNFDGVLSFDHTHEHGDIAFFQYGYGTPANFTYVGVSNPSETYSAYSGINFEKETAQGTALTLNYHPSSEWTLTSISGWREYRINALYSVTPPGGIAALGGLGIQSLNNGVYGPTFSQEFRAVYVGEKLKATTGATFFKEDVENIFGGAVTPLTAPPANPYAVATAPVVTTNTKSYAVFGQVDYSFTSQLVGTLGVRANREDREMDEVFTGVATHPTLSSTVTENKAIPKVGLSFKAQPDLMFYATVSQGYQAPGQSYSTSPTSPILVVASEKLIAYEVGAKSEWLDHRLRLNAAAFYYDYDPLHVRVTTGLNQFKIVDTGAKLEGAELEGAAILAPGLTLSGNVVGIHSKYTNFCDNPVPFDGPANCNLAGTTGVPTGVSRAGNPLNQAPNWTGNLTLNYERPLPNGMGLDLTGSYTYVGQYYSSQSAVAYTRTEALGTLNLRAGLKVTKGLEVYLFGRNVTNDISQGSLLYTALAGNVLDVGVPTAPRTYGVGARYSF